MPLHNSPEEEEEDDIVGSEEESATLSTNGNDGTRAPEILNSLLEPQINNYYY